ncbi:NACHT domain-containing protein [Lentzea sp. JNUCC 0626]|uniref:NACHT domain-containing protein n=1 Tax=Lentzea sp. JNUCC 0626 TaxID=3367513 RepID=UPI00374783A3
MSRPAKNSYKQALQVLRTYDRQWLDKTDIFLGISLLVDGAAEPDALTLFESKDEVAACLRRILDGISDTLMTNFGTARYELVAAANSIIAVTSLVEAYAETPDRHASVPPESPAPLDVPALTSSAVPTPNAASISLDPIDTFALTNYFLHASSGIQKFIANTEEDRSAKTIAATDIDLTIKAAMISEQHQISAALTIPEFYIWSAPTTLARTESLELFAELMGRLPSLHTTPDHQHRTNLNSIAESVLTRPVIGSNIDPSSVKVDFPLVEDGFIVPGYRIAIQDDSSTASSESWWASTTTARADLDRFLAIHFTGPECVTGPLLVLGNPGAGKSLLMEVIAARLPEDQFTAVLVQLRKVRAEDGIQVQIETALRQLLGKSVEWEALAESCGSGIPVILLDGFDELIQASGVHQSNYLHQVQEFQRQQALLGRPVAVVVTSRMLVADRARIPVGVPIVKLEEFDDDRIERWLDVWNTSNTYTPDFQALTASMLSDHLELARQPLLLLMLAIYAADSSQLSLDDANLSNAELYKRLIAMFVVRQVSQKGPRQPAPALVSMAAAESSWSLGIAAFAMFNRGHQFVTAPELNDDLAVFTQSQTASPGTSFDLPVDDADRTVENFFFIHSPTRNDGTPGELRTYEFLHATFGEYLIAEVTMKLLCQLAASQAVPSANPFQVSAPPDDSQLYALISHQAFVKRKPIIEFSRGLFTTLSKSVRADVLHTLDDLIRNCQRRPLSDTYQAYHPAPSTIISRIACYSANLVCLRALLDVQVPPPVVDLFGTMPSWRATVHLWQSGLDDEGWSGMTSAIMCSGTDERFVVPARDATPVVREARLLGDPIREVTFRAGVYSATADTTADHREQELVSKFTSWQLNISGSGATGRALPVDVHVLVEILDLLDAGVRMNNATHVHLAKAMSREASRLPRHVVARALEHLTPRAGEASPVDSATPFELLSILCSHPELAETSPISAELLPRMFEHRGHTAMGCLILMWDVIRSSDDRVGDAFRVLAGVTAAVAGRYLDNALDGYLPVETFEYLAEPRAVEPIFNKRLLESLVMMVDAAADEISPQTVLAVARRFPEPAHQLARRYLRRRTLGFSADEQEAVKQLQD